MSGGGTEGETSGGLEEAGFTEDDAAGLFPDEAAPAGGGGGAPAVPRLVVAAIPIR